MYTWEKLGWERGLVHLFVVMWEDEGFLCKGNCWRRVHSPILILKIKGAHFFHLFLSIFHFFSFVFNRFGAQCFRHEHSLLARFPDLWMMGQPLVSYFYIYLIKVCSCYRRSTEISLVIRQTLEECILTHLMPRSQVLLQSLNLLF